MQEFHYALSELAPELFRRIKDFRDKQNRIIFNLTAGFKAVHGFLQSLGMLHADELIYVFERTDHLIRIPKAPITISGAAHIRKHLQAFRKLSNGLFVSEPEIENVPETMVLKIADDYLLSTWGNIFMAEAKNEIYAEGLLPPICARVRYTPAFEKNVAQLDGNRFAILNHRVDQLCCFFQKSTNPKSLSFKELKGNPVPGSTHEFYAWSDREAARCFGHYENDVFVIDKFDTHLK